MWDDWYLDEEKTLQFDPNVNGQEDLKVGQKYIGETFSGKGNSGGNIKYRKDGSILFSNEKEAYQRIWSNTFGRNREQMAVIGTENVLVLPDYLNNNAKCYESLFCFSGRLFFI